MQVSCIPQLDVMRRVIHICMFAQKPHNLRLIMRKKPPGKPTYLISPPQDSQDHDHQGQTENCYTPD